MREQLQWDALVAYVKGEERRRQAGLHKKQRRKVGVSMLEEAKEG